jgi:hypothetical protein
MQNNGMSLQIICNLDNGKLTGCKLLRNKIHFGAGNKRTARTIVDIICAKLPRK